MKEPPLLYIRRNIINNLPTGRQIPEQKKGEIGIVYFSIGFHF